MLQEKNNSFKHEIYIFWPKGKKFSFFSEFVVENHAISTYY